MYIKSGTAYYNQDKWFDFGWKGYFKGYFKIYNGNSLVESRDLDSSGYVGDYITYKEHGDGYYTDTLPSVGTYQAKIVDMDGNVVAQSTIKIIKTATKIKVPSITVKPGTKNYVIATVYEKSCGDEHENGKVTFKINGKTYKVKIKYCVAELKIKMPSKLKTYTCKATFSGDKNTKSSSTTFKITVKKTISKKKTTTKKTTKFKVVVPTELNKKISKTYGKYKVQTYKWVDYYASGKKAAHLRITIYKDGKKLTNYKAKYYVHYSSGGGVWIYTDNHGETRYKSTNVGYNNVLKAYKVTVTVWP